MRIQSFDTPYGTDKYVMLSATELDALVASEASVIRSKMQCYGGETWYGDTFDSFQHKVMVGDQSLVAESDTFLEKLEDQTPHSLGWRNVDDVVGAVPNVPAFIAGHPQCMRRRERTRKDTAPLAIYMDLTSSGGISERDVTRRGVALLALTRVLIERRPVELWVGASLGCPHRSGTVAWRIDTAPLDLARAAYHVGATAMSRGFGYAICQHHMGTKGGWPFNDYAKHCRTAKQRLQAVFPGQEIMYVPPIKLHDELTKNPIGWIRRVLNEKGEE